jgi:hypothetical protein
VQTFFFETTAPPSADELALLAASGVKYIRHECAPLLATACSQCSHKPASTPSTRSAADTVCLCSFNWVTVEQEPNVYDWSYHDALVLACDSVGIRLLSTIANEENGGRNGHELGVRQQNHGLAGCNGGCDTWTNTSIAAYARFAAAAVARYAGRGFVWELDDEPLMFWRP